MDPRRRRSRPRLPAAPRPRPAAGCVDRAIAGPPADASVPARRFRADAPARAAADLATFGRRGASETRDST